MQEIDDKGDSMPKISVIVPIYNQEKYLAQCMRSIQNQTLKDIEILCVDDGSTDATPGILRNLAAKDSRIHIFTRSNAGPGVARNLGMEHAIGEYITFLDSDDVFKPDMLEKLYEKAKADDADVVVCRAESLNAESGLCQPMQWSIHDKLLPSFMPFSSLDVKKNFFKAFIWWPWDKIYKKSHIDALGLRYQELRSTEDLYFVCVAVLSAQRISYIQDVLVQHRIGISTSVSRNRENSWDHFSKALFALREYLCKNGIYQHFQQDFINYCLNFSLWHVETLHDKSYIKLYRTLKHKWFKDWQVYGHEKDYFYQVLDYEKLEFIQQEPDIRCFEFKAVFLEKTLKQREQNLLTYRKINNKLQVDVNKLQQQVNKEKKARVQKEKEIKKLHECNLLLQKHNEQIQLDRQRIQYELDCMAHSVSFRVGRVITFVPRKVRNGVRCYREHGVAYTIRRTLWHLGLISWKDE